jgi:hypothetical protein
LRTAGGIAVACAPIRCKGDDTDGVDSPPGASPAKDKIMAKSQQKSNKEVRKPKAVKVKTIAANASTKDKPVGMVTIKN